MLLTFITIHFFPFRFAGAARFDFGIQLGMVTCGHDASQQFGKRLLVHVEEHGANGWIDCVTGNLDSPHRVFEFCIPVEVSMDVVVSFSAARFNSALRG